MMCLSYMKRFLYALYSLAERCSKGYPMIAFLAICITYLVSVFTTSVFEDPFYVLILFRPYLLAMAVTMCVIALVRITGDYVFHLNRFAMANTFMDLDDEIRNCTLEQREQTKKDITEFYDVLSIPVKYWKQRLNYTEYVVSSADFILRLLSGVLVSVTAAGITYMILPSVSVYGLGVYAVMDSILLSGPYGHRRSDQYRARLQMYAYESSVLRKKLSRS